ncbi:MAG: hypothetical protein ACJ8M1_13705 [Chthoniobacterales bacterium]
MSQQRTRSLKLAVLNPGGRDSEQYFDSAGTPDSAAHPPVNFHGYAACTGGSFHRDTKHGLAERSPVLLLLRPNFRDAERALLACKQAKTPVIVSLKETGLHQVAEQLATPGVAARFFDIVRQADGCIGATPEAAELFRMCRPATQSATVGFIPTPYPLSQTQWDFSTRPDQQSGVFIGTREWDIPSRNHFAAMLLARNLCEATGEPVTVFNLDGRKGNRLLADFGFPAGKLRVHEKEKSYADYLREMAKHKIVLQLDRSRVPGQVAGDALLCRGVCVGGDSAIERIAFPKTCGIGRTFAEIGMLARDLLTDHNARGTVFVESQWRSMEQLSFEAVRKRLEKFFLQFK